MSTQATNLTAIADAIRTRKGTTDPIVANNFASEIESIDRVVPTLFPFTGNVDRVGLATLGYNEEEIDWFQSVVNWDAEFDEDNKVPQANLDLAGATEAEIVAAKKSVMYLPKSYFNSNPTLEFKESPIRALYVPEHVTDMYISMLGSNALYAINIVGKIERLGDLGFTNCYSLVSVELPEGLKTIGSSCFGGCKNLEIINIPMSVTFLGQSTFMNCVSLKQITIPPLVTSLYDDVFFRCTSLIDVELHNNLTYIGTESFHNTNIEYISIPDGATLGGNAFDGCSNLKELRLPSDLTEIPSYFCYQCFQLGSIEIPLTVHTIGNYAFRECHSLSYVKIPPSVTQIGSFAFATCTALITIDCSECISVPVLSNAYPFHSTFSTNFKILVPSALLPEFQSATNWSGFSSYMIAV